MYVALAIVGRNGWHLKWPIFPTLKILNEKSKSVAGVQQWPYKAVSKALEIIPRTLIQNCGANSIRVLTALRVW